MNPDFMIRQRGWLPSSYGPPEVRSTVAEIEIVASNILVTKIEELNTDSVRKTVRISAFLLARWLLEGWWRLRWEPNAWPGRVAAMDWRMTHEMSSIGFGFAWPPLQISGGKSMSFTMADRRHSEAPRFSPIRYLVSFAEKQIDPSNYETEVDLFVEMVLQRLDSLGMHNTELHELREVLNRERLDSEVSQYRRMEALLGFDPDLAPMASIKAILERGCEFGTEAVEEIAPALARISSNAEGVVDAISQLVNSVSRTPALGAVPQVPKIAQLFEARTEHLRYPWARGVQAATEVRSLWDLENRPLSTKKLANVLGFRQGFLSPLDGIKPPILSIGTRNDDNNLRILLRPRSKLGRRFEFARILGDLLFLGADERWAPVTSLHTARQQFQRAFAAELLCPSEALLERFGKTAQPDNVDFEDAAAEFEVDSEVVRRQYSNNLASHKLVGDPL